MLVVGESQVLVHGQEFQLTRMRGQLVRIVGRRMRHHLADDLLVAAPRDDREPLRHSNADAVEMI